MPGPHRRIAPLLGAVVGLATWAAGPPTVSAGDGAGDDISPVTLVDAGDTSFQLQLPAPAVAGDTAVTDRTETVRQVVNGPTETSIEVSLVYTQTTTVMAVAPDGSYVVRGRIDAFDTTGDVEMLPSDLDLLVGYTFEHTVGRDGTFQNGRELDAGRDRADPLTYFARRRLLWLLAYPAEPVGLGATWTVDPALPNSTVEITGPYRFEVVELTPDRYSLEIAWDQTVDDTFMGTAVTGTITGSVTLTASTTNVLDESFDFSQHAELEERRDTSVNTIVLDETFTSVSTPYIRQEAAA